MFRASRSTRFQVTIALAMLIAGKLSHCAWEEAVEFNRHSAAAAEIRLGHVAPWQRPVHDCDNESGCLCRGATIAQAVEVADFRAVDLGHLPLQPAPLPSSSVECRGAAPAGEFTEAPPISGRQLRALLASLTI